MINLDANSHLSTSETLRAPFHDIDPAGVVWHGRYFKYFELVRVKLLEQLAYSYEEMVGSGIVWPVVDSKVRYVKPIVLNQEFVVTATLVEWEFRMVVDYKIHDSDGLTMTKARTVQVPVDAITHELQFGCPQVFINSVEQQIDALQNK